MEETREEIKQVARQAREHLSARQKAQEKIPEFASEDSERIINEFIGGSLEVTPQQKMILSYARAVSLKGKLMPDTYKTRFIELIPEGTTYLNNLEQLAQRVAELQGGGAAVLASRINRYDVPEQVAEMFGVARRPPPVQVPRRRRRIQQLNRQQDEQQ